MTGAPAAPVGAIATARRLFAAAAAAALLPIAGCSAGTRDAVPPTRDVVVGAGAAPRSAEGYEYVARRPLATVALAEGRGIAAADTRAAVDHLADALDTCVTEQGRSGAPPRGAARVVAQIGDDGSVTNVILKLDPGVARGAPANETVARGAPANETVARGAPANETVARGAPANETASGAATALLCLVAPVKLLSFAPADAGARGLAIEAIWGTPSAPP
jgi:hypothetical protein